MTRYRQKNCLHVYLMHFHPRYGAIYRGNTIPAISSLFQAEIDL